jgi:demethoxyubiquinone hydroxylase (CLK1/Coq7/Cat5 family)
MMRLATCSRRALGAAPRRAAASGAERPAAAPDGAAAATAGPADERAADEAPLPPRAEALVRDLLRVSLVGEGMAAALRGGQLAGRRGPDADAAREDADSALQRVRALAAARGVRPSPLGPLAAAAFGCLGAAAALAPGRVGAGLAAGLADALADEYTDNLRALRTLGAVAPGPPALDTVRDALRALRDGAEAATEGAPRAPSLVELAADAQRLRELSPGEGAAAAAKAAAQLVLMAAART